MKNLELLNLVKDMLIAHANKNGIVLGDHFETVEAFKEFTIGFTFKQLTGAGMDTEQAFDLVLGDGEYNKLLDKTWSQANR